MTFEEFLNLLPQVNQASHPIRDESKAWADYQLVPNQRFVAPPLEEHRPIQLGQTSVVILSAPAAVGKSTVGREIARRAGAPFVNLAALKVGSHGASGLVVDLFGPGGAASAFDELNNGALLLVFDSLDETRLGSGEANFDAFLENLSTLFRNPHRNASAILLARTDTADWVELYLEDQGVPIARFSIDFFDESEAPKFVMRYVNDPTLTGGVPFQEALRGFLEALHSAVCGQSESWSSARSVLGYAPVLEAVGRYLLDEENRRNYYRLLQALQHEASEWDLLLQVAEALLVREHEKVVDQAKQSLAHLAGTWSGWEQLFSPGEQVLRLLAVRFNLAAPASQELPIALRNGYERLVSQALDDHPFCGSVHGLHPVLGEYVYARLFGGVPELPAALRDQCREVLRVSASYLPTRALGRFVLALTARDGEARISSRDFGFVYESLLADQGRPGDIFLLLRPDAGNKHKASVKISRRSVDFAVTDGPGGIWLWRRLAYASLSVNAEIELGFLGGEFRLGPVVDIECEKIRCLGELGVYLGNDSEEESVALVAHEFERMTRPPLVRGKRLYVRGDTVPWPWSDYADAEFPPSGASPEIINAYNHLARMLLWLRAEGYGEIARVDDLMETAASGPTAVAARLLRFCVDRGLFQKQDRLYRLNDDVAARYGINYVDLKRRILKQPVIELMSDFLKQR